MATAALKVLLVAESATGFSPLLERLEDSGYECQVVLSCLDGAQLIAKNSFDVALCSAATQNLASLLSAVRNSSASLFRYLLVEDGCWWVPSVLWGKPCSDKPALRDKELAGALRQCTSRTNDSLQA